MVNRRYGRTSSSVGQSRRREGPRASARSGYTQFLAGNSGDRPQDTRFGESDSQDVIIFLSRDSPPYFSWKVVKLCGPLVEAL